MDTSRISRIALAAALAASTLATGTAFAAAQSNETAPAAASRPVDVQSLSGAYLAAKQARENRQPDIAAQYYQKALSLDPHSQTLQQEAMFAYFADGRFAEGVKLANSLADNEDVGKVAHIALGLDALRASRFDAALRQLRLDDTSDLDTLLVGHLSAWAEAGAGRGKQALERIQGLAGAPWFAVFNQYQAGLLAGLSGNLPAARTALNSVISDQGSAQTSVDAFLAAAEALGRLEARAGKKADALAAIDKGLELAPGYEPLTHLRAEIDAGRTVAPPIETAQDGAAETLYILGQAINRGDGQDVALLYFQFAKAVSPTVDPKLLTAMAGVADSSKQVDLALSYYAQIPASSPYRRTAELQMGLDLWQAERKEQAKAHLREAVTRFPDDLQAHLVFADVLSADKSYREAVELLDRAIELAPEDGPNNWNIYYQRGIAHERLKEWDKAEPDFKKALELQPDQPQVLNYLGYSWVDMNRNLDEGLEMIRTAVDLRPNDGYIIDSLGWAYYRLGRFDDAVEQLERAVLLTPADPTINDHLGDAYWQVGRKREAHFQWDRALAGDPQPEEAEIAKIKRKLAEGLDAVSPNPAAQPPAAERAANEGTPTTRPN